MKDKRVIVHSDINHCYAQIEEMKFPQLRDVPMAVGGHEEARHGIILAKNDFAKTYDIKTGESLREAYAKCPQLTIVHPDYEEYIYYTQRVKDIYREYSDRVESYGLDEAWIDLSESTRMFGSGYTIAKTIQQRVFEEIGLTISMGLSFNKIFAKLGSDMDKHMGLVCITKENYKDKVWGLPVEDLFYVGKATKKKLQYLSITTIGDVARLPIGFMKDHLGKIGELLWWFANGEDVSEVVHTSHVDDVKSIGNAITSVKDITTLEEAKLVYFVLVESVASRMRDQGLQGNVVRITLRTKELTWCSRQRKLAQASNLSAEIMPHVMDLVNENHDFRLSLRTIGVTMSGLKQQESGYQQMNFFVSEQERAKQKRLEETMDEIRTKFGFSKAKRCAMLLDKELTNFNPKEDHIVYPQSFF